MYSSPTIDEYTVFISNHSTHAIDVSIPGHRCVHTIHFKPHRGGSFLCFPLLAIDEYTMFTSNHIRQARDLQEGLGGNFGLLPYLAIDEYIISTSNCTRPARDMQAGLGESFYLVLISGHR